MDQTTKILEERGQNYGDYKAVAALSQVLEDAVRKAAQYPNMPAHHKESIKMILQKISRLVNGNFNHKDGWDDIAGYARLISIEIERNALVQVEIEPSVLDTKPYAYRPFTQYEKESIQAVLNRSL